MAGAKLLYNLSSMTSDEKKKKVGLIRILVPQILIFGPSSFFG